VNKSEWPSRAIFGKPRGLILNEPTASHDGDTGKVIIAFVKVHG